MDLSKEIKGRGEGSPVARQDSMKGRHLIIQERKNPAFLAVIKDGTFCVSQDSEGGKRGVIYFCKCHQAQTGASHILKFSIKVGGA